MTEEYTDVVMKDDIKKTPMPNGWFKCVREPYYSEALGYTVTESWYEKDLGGGSVLYDHSQQTKTSECEYCGGTIKQFDGFRKCTGCFIVWNDAPSKPSSE